jgi:hypothetical protein
MPRRELLAEPQRLIFNAPASCRAALIDQNRQRCVFSSFSFYSATEMALNRKKIGIQTFKRATNRQLLVSQRHSRTSSRGQCSL